MGISTHWMSLPNVKTRGPREREETLGQLRACLQALEEKKADEIVVLDVTGKSSITDYLVVASGKSDPHLRALRESIMETVKTHGIELIGIDTAPQSGWVVVDAFDFMVHLFLPEKRDFYRLEALWKDAERVEMDTVMAV